MIQLRSDCLVFKTSQGEAIPCSAEWLTVELIGDSIEGLDPELVRNAAAAVLHYFKCELGSETVSIPDFSNALAKVLRGFGFQVILSSDSEPKSVTETDLRELAMASGKGFELFFFNHLRDILRQQLGHSPDQVRFNGLRGCVKQLVGARRWSIRCEHLSDQIVEFLRRCLCNEAPGESCSLVVR